MATNLPITDLDFFESKEALKNFLRGQNRFKDYDFEGSNLSVLLDVLAYNTFQGNFYTNMAVSEMFLDSASRKNSAVSHAKELNYLPRSATSAKARVRVIINRSNDTVSTITIPKGTEFNAAFQGGGYVFTTQQTYIARKVDANLYVAEDVEISEGVLLTSFTKEGFFVDSPNMKCVLSNENADISSVSVYVNAETNVFTRAEDIAGIGKDSKVFYLEPYFDGRYAVVFGQNLFGVQPSINDDIRISYRVSSGKAANGAKKFTTSFLPDNIIVETLSNASGGADPESIEDIRYYAPKSIQIQERAVVADDYATLIKQRFPEVQSIGVFGGETLTPPRFGSVAISVNLTGDAKVTEGLKATMKEYITTKAPVGTRVVFLDPMFTNAALRVEVFVARDLNKTPKDELEGSVRAAIQNFNRDFLEDFGTTLRSSRLAAVIDAVSPAFTGTTISANPIIEFVPDLNRIYNITLESQTRLKTFYPFDEKKGFDNYQSALVSTNFKYRGMCCYMQDNGKGVLQIVKNESGKPKKLVNKNAGTIDYAKGSITLTNFVAEDFAGSSIRFTLQSLADDISSASNRILSIDDNDVEIVLTEVRSNQG